MGLKLIEKVMKVFERVLVDSSEKELRSTRNSAASCQSVAILVHFSLYVSY